MDDILKRKEQENEKVIPASDDLLQHIQQNQDNPAIPKLPDSVPSQPQSAPASLNNSTVPSPSSTEPLSASQPLSNDEITALGSQPTPTINTPLDNSLHTDAAQLANSPAPTPESDQHEIPNIEPISLKPPTPAVDLSGNPIPQNTANESPAEAPAFQPNVPSPIPAPLNTLNQTKSDGLGASSLDGAAHNFSPTTSAQQDVVQPESSTTSQPTPATHDPSLNAVSVPNPPASVEPNGDATSSGDNSSSDNTKENGITDEQQRFIKSPAWGPLLAPWYFVANHSLKYSLLYIFIIFILPLLAFGSLVGIVALSEMSDSAAATEHSDFPAYIVFGLIGLICVGALIFAALKGRQIAWKSRQWSSYEDFVQSQKKWNFWAKMYVPLFAIGYALYVILSNLAIGWAALILSFSLISSGAAPIGGPSYDTRLDEAGDTQVKSDVSTMSQAVEACYTATAHTASGTYNQCDNPGKIVSGGYLSRQPSTLISITPYTGSQFSEVLVYARLAADTATCQKGSGPHKYYVYDSVDGSTFVYCGTTAPRGPIS